ncbi:hypothetical protein SELMODRAFT_186618 [Selaginella moellendorffii]|uniref:RING-type domain-containing protein n=1 Tax=Selaginella moellendorffii TaxID=88036 RepID=D8T9E8_SELML|nr:hypothetical protein SELMODRAFT_186618 [Selaginella moellendorffii]
MVNNGTSADFTNPSMSRVGLGYGIAIAVGILVLVSTIMLASYVCVRQQSSSRDRSDGEWTISGLDQVTLESYPRIVFSAQQPLPHPQDTACAICLADYREAEMLRVLPDCRHVFHVQCIDSWMRLQATCPMCRTSPLPTPQATPISTPLSELIPLARHPR